jgi:hypothetical protein
MSRLATVACSPSAIWPYKLAKKNTGMNTIMTISKMMFSTRKAWLPKMRTFIRGDAVRCSTATKTPRSSRPATMHSSITGLLQPQMEDCWSPNTLRATPLTIKARPR